MPSRSSLRDWPSESAKFAVRWYVREAGNLSVAMETDSGQRLSPEGIETLDGSLFLRVASSHSICPGGSTEVGEGGLWDRDNFPC